MITALELAHLALEGNLESEKYKILTVQPKDSFEKALADEVCYHHNCDSVCACVGAVPYCGEIGYLVKMVKIIPTAHCILGNAEAIYEVETGEGETLYYVVWAINKD